MKDEWGWRKMHNLTECGRIRVWYSALKRDAQSNRMSIIGEGIEGIEG